MEFRVHWLSVTIWENPNNALRLWDEWFEKHLGIMTGSGHGGRGFRKLFSALASAKLYADPVTVKEGEMDGQYVHIELPGLACDALPDEVFQEFITYLDRFEDFKMTRLDLAWDDVPFTPAMVEAAVAKDQMRSLFKRNTMVYINSVFEEREDGQLGTSSIRLGSNQSTRMIRVYDKRGPVRLEFQSRHERAHLIAKEVLMQEPAKWIELAVPHLRDYIDFQDPETEQYLEWWTLFVGEFERALRTVSNARELELNRMIEWVNKQVSPTLSVLADVVGEQAIQAFVIDGRRKRTARYKPILQLVAKKGED